jgi:ribosomal protein L21E
MLTAYFELRENDIRTLKLNDKIRIDNSWWHINKVIDYDANSTNLTKVELMSVDQEIDLPTFVRKPFIEEVPTRGRRPLESVVNEWYNRNNVNLSFGSVVTKGLGNVVIEGLTGVVEGSYKTMTENGILAETVVPYSPLKIENSNYNVLDTDAVVILK